MMKTLHILAYGLMAIGALNWGLVSIFNFNLVAVVLGSWPVLVKLVYLLIGVSGAYSLLTHRKDCKAC